LNWWKLKLPCEHTRCNSASACCAHSPSCSCPPSSTSTKSKRPHWLLVKAAFTLAAHWGDAVEVRLSVAVSASRCHRGHRERLRKLVRAIKSKPSPHHIPPHLQYELTSVCSTAWRRQVHSLHLLAARSTVGRYRIQTTVGHHRASSWPHRHGHRRDVGRDTTTRDAAA
jgi:hypothetical protein